MWLEWCAVSASMSLDRSSTLCSGRGSCIVSLVVHWAKEVLGGMDLASSEPNARDIRTIH